MNCVVTRYRVCDSVESQLYLLYSYSRHTQVSFMRTLNSCVTCMFNLFQLFLVPVFRNDFLEDEACQYVDVHMYVLSVYSEKFDF